jgi:hypothetical protein
MVLHWKSKLPQEVQHHCLLHGNLLRKPEEMAWLQVTLRVFRIHNMVLAFRGLPLVKESGFLGIWMHQQNIMFVLSQALKSVLEIIVKVKDSLRMEVSNFVYVFRKNWKYEFSCKSLRNEKYILYIQI